MGLFQFLSCDLGIVVSEGIITDVEWNGKAKEARPIAGIPTHDEEGHWQWEGKRLDKRALRIRNFKAFWLIAERNE